MDPKGETKEISEPNPEQQELRWLEDIHYRVKQISIELMSIRDELSQVAHKGSYPGKMHNNHSLEQKTKCIHDNILIDLMMALARKVDEIHRLHFAEQYLHKKKNIREKFLAEILVTRARNQKK